MNKPNLIFFVSNITSHHYLKMFLILPRIYRNYPLRSTLCTVFRHLQTTTTSINTPLLVSQIVANTTNPWIYRQNDSIKLPVIKSNVLDLPNSLKYVPPLIDPVVDKIIDAPPLVHSDIPKEAARLIVIRRKKMKKHKLRKLRKRMKYVWAKLRQKRELRKEKVFQDTLIQQCKKAEAFSAEQYVQERIDKLNEIIIPKYWKGKRLPEWLIRQKMGLPPKQ